VKQTRGSRALAPEQRRTLMRTARSAV
jgi:hypothetical protein